MPKLLYIVYNSGALRVYQQITGAGLLCDNFCVRDESGSGRLAFVTDGTVRRSGIILSDRTVLVLGVVGADAVVPVYASPETWSMIVAHVARWVQVRQRNAFGTVLLTSDGQGSIAVSNGREIMSS